MARYNAIKDNGDTDEIGALRFLFRLFRAGYGSGVAVSQRGAGANMSVDVAVGDVNILDTDRAYWGWSDAVENVTVTASNPSNPRKDIVVAYIDKAISTTTPNNNQNGLKFLVVAGTPAASPVDPSDGTIQTAVGAGNPWIKLARIDVAASSTSVVNANITDLRNPAALAVPYVYGGATNTKGHLVPNVADDTVALLNAAQTVANKTIDNTNVLGSSLITLGYVEKTDNFSTASATAVQVTGLSATVTIPAGGRKIEIVAYFREVTNTVGPTTARGSIWDGTVGSGTQLVESPIGATMAAINYFAGGSVVAVHMPSAGSKTYNVGLSSTAASNVTMTNGALARSFISVRAL